MAQKLIQTKKTTLSYGINDSATTLRLTNLLKLDGTAISASDIGDILYGTFDPGTSREEIFSIAGANVTVNSDGTVDITSVVRGLQEVSPYSTGGFATDHPAGAVVVFGNNPQLFNTLAFLANAQTFSALQTFTLLPRSNGGNATVDTELVTYAQALAMATGTASINRVVVAGNAGETVVAGNLLYLDVADGEWKKCDADTAGSVNNIILGIAQGAGTDGNPITSGVLLFGLDSNQTGLTTNTAYYASNTAGGISTTPGTTEVSVGISRSTTSILFYPRYNQMLTEDQQDALVGNNGTPSASNLFMTQSGFQNGAETYAATATGNDTYAITLSPALTAYANGQIFKFKADVGNTGACSLNVNGLGAITIKKLHDQDLATGDIEANQIVTVVYNSTGPVFEMVSQVAVAVNTNKLDVVYTDVPVSGTGVETTILTVAVPANTLSTNNAIRGKIYFSERTVTTTSKVLRLKYGSTTIATVTMPSGATTDITFEGYIDFLLLGAGATNAQEGSISIYGSVAGINLSTPTGLIAISGADDGTAVEDSTGALNLTVTWEHNSADTFNLRHAVTEKIT